MAEKTGTAGAAGRAPSADQPDSVRNVALVGHSGAGKTTLVEALLVGTGAIQRAGRVEDGSTVSDFDEVEVRQQRSVNLALAPIVHAGVKVNLLDTPGYADFTGDLRAGLRAADAALFTVSAAEGVDGLTKLLWDECAAVGMPRAVVITKIDHHRADFSEALAACREAFGDSVAPLYLPVAGAQGGVRGLIGLLSGQFYDYSGGSRTESSPEPGQADGLAESRSALIEAIIQESEDESLMDSYLAGDDLDVKGLIEDLEKAVARGSFYPVLAASAPHGIGIAELVEVITQAFPAPQEHPLPAVTTVDGKPATGLSCDPAGPLLAEVVKTTSDPYVGRIPGPGVLRHPAARRRGARIRSWPGRSRPRRPRPGRAGGRADVAAGQAAAERGAMRRRRHLRRSEALQRGNIRHAVRQGPPADHGVVGNAGAAAARGDHGQIQGR